MTLPLERVLWRNGRLHQRRADAAAWTSDNDVLLDGEFGVELDTYKFKIGDGTTAWNSLPYAAGEGGGADGASAYEVAVDNGFVGTEEDWLASLVGEQGPQGDPGADGEPGADGAGAVLNRVCDGRLTLTSGLPITTNDVTAAGSIYFTPYLGNHISLYTSGVWTDFTFTELTYTVSATSGKNHFLLLWNDAGTRRLVRSPAWTGDNTVGTGAASAEIELFEGVLVNKVDISGGPLAREGRVVGGFRANGTNLTEDSIANRLLANLQNREHRIGARVDSGSHAFNTLTRVWNGGTDTRVTWFQLFAGPVAITVHCDTFVGTSNSYILPSLNGAVAGAPAGGNDYGHFTEGGGHTPHVKALDFALAGYNYADVYEYEFSGNNVTSAFGRTYVELFQ